MRLYDREKIYLFSFYKYARNHFNSCLFKDNKTSKQETESCHKKGLLIWIDWPGVGDLFTALDSIYKLYLGSKEEFRVFLACNETQKRILEAIGFSYFDDLIVLSTNLDSYNDFKRNVDSLNVQHWDTIILLDSMTRTHRRVLLCLRYGTLYEANYEQISIKNKFFDKIIRSNNKLNANPLEWIVENRIKIVECFLNNLNGGDKCVDSCYVLPKLSNDECCLLQRYCIICPGVANGHSHENRAWPLERFGVVVNYILSHSDLDVVITGVEDDFHKGEYIQNKSRDFSRVHNLTGKTSLKEWIALIQNAKFVFGNDSGYIHIAALAGTPSFVLLGFWDYGRFLPYKDGHGCIEVPVIIKTEQPECSFCDISRRQNQTRLMCDNLVKEKGVFKCIDEISPDLVIRAIKKCL